MTRWRRGGRSLPPVAMPPLTPIDAPARVVPPALPALPPVAESPEEDRLRPEERWRRIVAVAEALAADRAAAADLAIAAGYPPEAWDQFCRDIPLRPPPSDPAMPITILVDARTAAPFRLRATLRSLQDQAHGDWRAEVLATPAIRDHPVASFADTDARIAFVDRFDAAGRVAPIEAGVVLDPNALAWLCFALARTGADAAFVDHDHGIADPGLRLVRADPMLFGVHDPAMIGATGTPLLVVGTMADGADQRDCSAIRAALLSGGIRVAAVPRVLATRLALPLAARSGSVAAEDVAPVARSMERPLPPPSGVRIAVIVPTRDSAPLLARAIDTLRDKARDPARLDVVVVDNRSAAPETAAMLARFAAEGAARTIAFDAPFNWSLASNRGAAASDAPLIVFANNDIEMLSRGWDDRVAAALAEPGVGAVGARLVYPNRTVQHAGIAAGFGPLGSEHEGRGVPVSDPGPGRRYVVPHAVAAVTGAFLAVRRADFARVGGFDAAQLMIAHSDIDLCLRLRALGLTIRYEPGIEAIHHEGASRGVNRSRAAIAWDEGERGDLIARWGEGLLIDPGVSPYWMRGQPPFTLLREPSIREILEQIDRSVSPAPWRPAPADDRPPGPETPSP